VVYDNGPDKYGFGRYSIVVHAPAGIADAVQRFRAALGMGHVATAPHVSILSHLYELTDLRQLTSRLRRLVGEQPPVRVTFLNPGLRCGDTDAVLAVAPTSELAVLRAGVWGALSGIVQSSPIGDNWSPHLTLYQGGNTQTARRAEALAGTLDVGTGFDALAVDVVGRIGAPPGGVRTIIASIPLA
jgi:hypothetical protein